MPSPSETIRLVSQYLQGTSSYGQPPAILPIAGRISDQSTITLGTPAGTTQDVTIDLLDGNGDAIAGVRKVEVYFCTDEDGATPDSAGPGDSVTASTGSVLTESDAGNHLTLLSDGSGTIVLSLDNDGGAGAYTARVALVLPDGGVVVSDALAIANSSD